MKRDPLHSLTSIDSNYSPGSQKGIAPEPAEIFPRRIEAVYFHHARFMNEFCIPDIHSDVRRTKAGTFVPSEKEKIALLQIIYISVVA